jgi:Protein of unknown function, DUF547
MVKPMNSDGPVAAPEPDPAGLSRLLLGEARQVEGRPRCDRLEQPARRLRGVDPAAIDGDGARLAFWINLYNALLLHRLCLRPIRGSVLRQPRLFSTAAYAVGGEPYSLSLIEHGLLRGNRRPPYHLRRPLRASDVRLRAAPSQFDPRIHFALNCGAKSCPPIHLYEPDSIEQQLELATRAYLRAETEVDIERGRVGLPGLMRLYRADFGDRADQLELAARHVPAVGAAGERHGERLEVRHGRFDWTSARGREALPR